MEWRDLVKSGSLYILVHKVDNEKILYLQEFSRPRIICYYFYYALLKIIKGAADIFP